jgi:hypothetical protein
MSTAETFAEDLLQQATNLARSSRNLEIMNLTAILRGYLELTKMDPTNHTYRKDMEDAAANLLSIVTINGH